MPQLSQVIRVFLAIVVPLGPALGVFGRRVILCFPAGVACSVGVFNHGQRLLV
jgi:hypothetical protein